MKTCSEIALCLCSLVNFFSSLETKMILKSPNKTFLRITRYIECSKSSRRVLGHYRLIDRAACLLATAMLCNALMASLASLEFTMLALLALNISASFAAFPHLLFTPIAPWQLLYRSSLALLQRLSKRSLSHLFSAHLLLFLRPRSIWFIKSNGEKCLLNKTEFINGLFGIEIMKLWKW